MLWGWEGGGGRLLVGMCHLDVTRSQSDTFPSLVHARACTHAHTCVHVHTHALSLSHQGHGLAPVCVVPCDSVFCASVLLPAGGS